MKLGIDFGTTRIVVAAADRGNFPVVAFECPDGASREWYPPLIALANSTRRFGWHAWAAQNDSTWTVVRSLKRSLAMAGPESRLSVGDSSFPLMDLLTGLTAALRRDLLSRSSLPLKPGEPLEAYIGVPANANGNQRFLTAEAFRLAGFAVLGLLNEPSAASLEYAHRQAGRELPDGEKILVYDLGGGTFDASLVERSDTGHAVAATGGVATLGGDDFDEVLASLALDAAAPPISRDDLNSSEEFTLLEECRERKEALHPNTRRLVIDLDRVREGWGQVTVPAAEFYTRCQPLIDETLDVTAAILSDLPEDSQVSLYVTGGGSELPLVNRLLRDRFGRRVKRSAYTRSATAIGLAIQADGQSGCRLQERFTRFFGVWRETEAGARIVFDPLFDRDTQLPGPAEPPLTRSRTYHPAHNIGHFRYLECSQRSPEGQPVGDIANWDEIRFPFDPALADLPDLAASPVTRSPAAAGQTVEELYLVDSGGSVTVTISNLSAGYRREYRLGQWAAIQPAVAPNRTRRRKLPR